MTRIDKVQRFRSITDVLNQIEAEYREMPGLNVTAAQAQRLWGLDHATCKRALETLVDRGVLRRTRREAYVGADTFSTVSAAPAVWRDGVA